MSNPEDATHPSLRLRKIRPSMISGSEDAFHISHTSFKLLNEVRHLMTTICIAGKKMPTGEFSDAA